MRGWPNIELADLKCPTILLVGSKNENVMNYVEVNRQALDKAGIQVNIIDGLNHQQEFNKINLVFQSVNSFLKYHTTRPEINVSLQDNE